MSTQEAALTSDNSSHSSKKRRGRKKSWWITECFVQEYTSNSSGSGVRLQISCKACAYMSYASTPNATQLGKHVLDCSKTAKKVNERLLLENEHYADHYRKLGSSATVYGVPETPNIKYRKRSTSFVLNHRKTFVKSEKSEAGEVSTDSLDSFEKRSKIRELRTSLIVNQMLPFSILSREQGKNELYLLLKVLNPLYAEDIPSAKRMASNNLDAYYQQFVNRTKGSVNAGLQHSFGTLIFDGWKDEQQATVVNVLLSITGINRTRKTFFLRSKYTGSEKCDASLYANIVADSMVDFGDMKNISGVTSDDTSACEVAKAKLVGRFNWLISCHDQTHFANLLMQDIGALAWIKDVLDVISSLVTDLRNRPKLYFRFKKLKEEYNATLRSNGYEAKTKELDKCSRLLPPRTAILPVKMATTRFASSEGMIQSFVRSHTVYRRLVGCQDFAVNLFGSRNNERRMFFETAVGDDTLFEKCLDVYHVLRVVRQYLRFFDNEESFISEVLPVTLRLRQQLGELPATPFFTPERKGDMLQVFEDRMVGTRRKVPLLTPLNYVAYALDISSAREDISEYNVHILNQMGTFISSDAFPPSAKLPSAGGVDGAMQNLFEEFSFTRMEWNMEMDDGSQHPLLLAYGNMPVIYWIQKEKSLLRTFALRILCVSPSSSSVERSFSAQKRIRTSIRNRLHPEKVKKMVFCAFNNAIFNSTTAPCQGTKHLINTDQKQLGAPATTGGMDGTDEVIIHAGEELSDGEELEGELDWEEINDDSLPLLGTVEMEAILEA